ncbi:MAG: helix-turn-helix domain-containing protein [Oscillospiraceae bacterium]|nr:helix-turn-helix domain-containing protein [Oscillospiraceae bacterium]
MKFHEKLQELRKGRGLSQEALAEILDVSRQAVSKWESGQTYPETDKLIALAKLFDVTLDSLLQDGQPLEFAGTTVRQGGQSARWQYEYKSKRTLFGLPLVHVNVGFGLYRAKGILAIGTIATGLLSIGAISVGLLSIGAMGVGLIALCALAFGILAFGSVAVGVFAVGALAIGIFALGALSIGMFSTGALAVASHVAIGSHAYGHIAVGNEVAEGVRVILDTNAAGPWQMPAEPVRAAITEEFPGLWNWVVRWATMLLR